MVHSLHQETIHWRVLSSFVHQQKSSSFPYLLKLNYSNIYCWDLNSVVSLKLLEFSSKFCFVLLSLPYLKVIVLPGFVSLPERSTVLSHLSHDSIKTRRILQSWTGTFSCIVISIPTLGLINLFSFYQLSDLTKIKNHIINSRMFDKGTFSR